MGASSPGNSACQWRSKSCGSHMPGAPSGLRGPAPPRAAGWCRARLSPRWRSGLPFTSAPEENKKKIIKFFPFRPRAFFLLLLLLLGFASLTSAATGGGGGGGGGRPRARPGRDARSPRSAVPAPCSAPRGLRCLESCGGGGASRASSGLRRRPRGCERAWRGGPAVLPTPEAPAILEAGRLRPGSHLPGLSGCAAPAAAGTVRAGSLQPSAGPRGRGGGSGGEGARRVALGRSQPPVARPSAASPV